MFVQVAEAATMSLGAPSDCGREAAACRAYGEMMTLEVECYAAFAGRQPAR
jgi:hypothetical protein